MRYFPARSLPLAVALCLARPAWATGGIDCLRKAYPEFVVAIDEETLELADGSRMPFGKGTRGDFESRLNSADLRDQMSQCYPAGFPVAVPQADNDPGRLRSESFFRRLYGGSAEIVQSRLRPVYWAPAGKTVSFTAVGGADRALTRVGKAIAARPAASALVSRLAGTFNWRPIQGTGRQSAHSFGAAIDFQLPKGLGHYWQWSGCRPGQRCAFPAAVLKDADLQEVVRIFESEGFIWGGKWHHFDTIHFEYRPELLVSGCAC
ncbi:MAG TPA: M15 family metallopeptidase [Accumulibacter sp.]|nr:M15 family metallopeptidase [Accumulibacter sp.]HQC81411.1 M15 family metallopeptidase [Accumulibacter sp.]